MAEVGFYTQANNASPVEIASQYGAVANSAEQNRLLQTQNQQARMDMVKGQIQYLTNGLGALASKPDLSQADMLGFANRALQEGIISPETHAAETAAVQAAGNDPQALRGLATNYGLRALDAGKQFDVQFGTPGMIDNGQTQTPVTTSTLTGIRPIGAPIQNTLSPAQIATPATIGINANNQPIIGTTGQFLEQTGSNALTGLPSAPAQPANPLMPNAAPQAAPIHIVPIGGEPAPVQLPPIAQPGGGIVTTPVPGAVAAQEAVGSQSGTQLATDLAQASAYQQNVLPLMKAIPALESLGTSGTGPGKEQVNQIFSFLQSMGVPGIDPAGIQSFDEAKKYLVQYVNNNGNSGTNEKLAASFAGNPSVEISNAAAIDVAKTALALSRMQNAQVRAFQESGLPADQYSKTVAAWNAQQDPRAYGIDMMTPQARAALIGSLSGDEKARFAASLRTAMQLGLVSPPSQGAPANGQ